MITKKEAIKKALNSTDYLGSHRYQVFEQVLNDNGYKIVRKGKVKDASITK